MKVKQSMALTLGFLLSVQSALPAAEKKPGPERRVQLQWSDLPALVTGQKISTVLPGNKRVQGKVLAVEPDALVLDVTKTSDRTAYAKGRASIPRTSVTEIRMTRRSGHVWQIAGTVLGAVVGLMVCGAVLAYSGYEGGYEGTVAALVAALAGGFGLLGYWGGRVLDRKVTIITIVPDETQ